MFNMTSYEYEEEPVDEFFTNLYIASRIAKQEQLEAKHAG